VDVNKLAGGTGISLSSLIYPSFLLHYLAGPSPSSQSCPVFILQSLHSPFKPTPISSFTDIGTYPRATSDHPTIVLSLEVAKSIVKLCVPLLSTKTSSDTGLIRVCRAHCRDVFANPQ